MPKRRFCPICMKMKSPSHSHEKKKGFKPAKLSNIRQQTSEAAKKALEKKTKGGDNKNEN